MQLRNYSDVPSINFSAAKRSLGDPRLDEDPKVQPRHVEASRNDQLPRLKRPSGKQEPRIDLECEDAQDRLTFTLNIGMNKLEYCLEIHQLGSRICELSAAGSFVTSSGIEDVNHYGRRCKRAYTTIEKSCTSTRRFQYKASRCSMKTDCSVFIAITYTKKVAKTCEDLFTILYYEKEK